MRSVLRLLAVPVAAMVVMLGLGVAAPATAQPPAPPEPTLVGEELLDPDNSYDIIRSYYVKGSAFPNTVLRRGTTTWGYTHLVYNGRWSSWFDNEIARVLDSWSGYSKSGTAVTFRRQIGFTVWMRVVVEYGSGHRGIITAYRYYP
ncbi:MAG: hypothetical protein ACRDVN_10845 [Jiangellaceae bacterium]